MLFQLERLGIACDSDLADLKPSELVAFSTGFFHDEEAKELVQLTTLFLKDIERGDV